MTLISNGTSSAFPHRRGKKSRRSMNPVPATPCLVVKSSLEVANCVYAMGLPIWCPKSFLLTVLFGIDRYAPR